MDTGDEQGSLLPLFSRGVAGHVVQLVRGNLLLVALFVALAFLSHLKVGIAWQAHAVGFAAGLLLIGPATKLALHERVVVRASAVSR
jgi:membrane associated rhomboid family serine protease